MTAAAIPSAEPRSPAMIRRAVSSSVIGNGLDWYDFGSKAPRTPEGASHDRSIPW